MKRLFLTLLTAAAAAGCSSSDSLPWTGGTDADTDTEDADAGTGEDAGADSGTDTDSETEDTETETTDTETETDTATEEPDTETETEPDTESDTTTACPDDVAALDPATNICWQIYYGGPGTMADAEDYCDDLVLGGYNDWVLASRENYLSILDGCPSDVLAGGIGYCYGCAASPVCYGLLGDVGSAGVCFYTSPYASPGIIWGVCLYNGYIATGPDTNPDGYARCIRTGA